MSYRIRLVESGVDEPGERYGYMLELTWGDKDFEDTVSFSLDTQGVRFLVDWVEWAERCVEERGK